MPTPIVDISQEFLRDSHLEHFVFHVSHVWLVYRVLTNDNSECNYINDKPLRDGNLPAALASTWS